VENEDGLGLLVAYEGIGRDTTAFTRTVPRGPRSAVDAAQCRYRRESRCCGLWAAGWLCRLSTVDQVPMYRAAAGAAVWEPYEAVA
jgi:hypothetical protein